MQIGIDISSILPPRTGVGYYTLGLIRELVKTDEDQFHFLMNSFRRKPPKISELHASNVTLHRHRWPGPWLLEAWQRMEWPSIERFVGEVDVFHSPSTYIPPQHRGARVTTIHDLWFLDHPEHCDRLGGLYLRRRLPKVLHRLTGIIAVSEFTRQQTIERFKFPEDRIFTVHSGVRSVFQPIPSPPRLHDTNGNYLPETFILSVSTLEPRKNIAGLLKGYKCLLDTIPDAPPLVLTGTPAIWSDEPAKWMETIERPPLKNRVVFTGYLPEIELPALYSAATLFVLPSFCEGFGLPLLESMSCGTAVTCSRGSALEEVGGDAAVYFDPENPEEIADVMRRVLESESLRNELIQKGRKRAETFTWKKCAEKTRAIYHRLA